MFLIGIFTVLIMVLWFVPIFRKMPKDYRYDKKFLIKTVIYGILIFIVAVIIQNIFAALLGKGFKLPETSLLFSLLMAIIGYGLVEELMKFLVGSFSLKKSKFHSKFDYMLIFALSALGFTLIETFLYSSAFGLVGIIRGLFPFHIMWQVFMGAHYYEYKVAKRNNDSKAMKKEWLLAFAVPILMHACCDSSVVFINRAIHLLSTANLAVVNMADILSLIIPLIYMVILIIFTVVTAYKFYKYTKSL